MRLVHEASRQDYLSVDLAEGAIQAGFGAYSITAHNLVTDLAANHAREPARPAAAFSLAPKLPVTDEV